MKVEVARQEVEEYSYLIGTWIDQTVVDKLIIVPINDDGIEEIIKQVLWGESYDHLLYGYNEFKVVALL